MTSQLKSNKYGTLWTRDELILAFELYCRIPFKKTKANNPEVIKLAEMLSRTPASVARKLGNFGSFDPELKKHKISRLVHASKMDSQIWEEFNSNWNVLVLEARRLRDNFTIAPLKNEIEIEIKYPHGTTEIETIRKTRVHQAFFRDVILSSYEETCCITGLKIKECLVASHIVPWSVSERFRTDPSNGLCLSATFDRLFDRGLITLTDDFFVIISSSLQQSDDKKINDMINVYHDAQIIKPHRFMPSNKHLAWHRDNVFKD